MTNWSLPRLLDTLHDSVQHELRQSRDVFGHPVAKGDRSESVWIRMLGEHLPQRYSVARAVVADSNDLFSDAIDVVVFDRQYSPFILSAEGIKVVPAESVYAVFEAKQAIDAAHVRYAQAKVASVRRLHRTSLPVRTVLGTASAKEPDHILGGILALDSGWSNPTLGEPLRAVLAEADEASRLDLGCVASCGSFKRENGEVTIATGGKPATAFLLELMTMLQGMATVGMIDVRAYARWLDAAPGHESSG